MISAGISPSVSTVSYTHLDVYKRQAYIAAHPGDASTALDLFMIDKYLERLGDLSLIHI